MKTFIALTFAFLGFAFYELSGGEDFAPASERVAAAKPAQQQVVAKAEAPAPAPAVETTAITTANVTPDITRVALNLTSVDESATPAAQITPAVATTRQPEPKIEPVALERAVILDSADTPQIILPSLIATTTTPDGPRGDIRSVTGNRVNVRGGPSTSYGVVGKLRAGDNVRVLDDNGNGWVLMEAIDGSAEGWMADFLLTSG